MKIIKFNNDIKKFKKDSRILLSSKLINKLKKPMSRKNHLESIKRYFYVEKVLNKVRLSLNLNKEMKINQIDYIKNIIIKLMNLLTYKN